MVKEVQKPDDRRAQIDMMIQHIAELVYKTPCLPSYEIALPDALTPEQQDIAREAAARAAVWLCVPLVVLLPDLDARGKEGEA